MNRQGIYGDTYKFHYLGEVNVFTANREAIKVDFIFVFEIKVKL
jgi:hypothetical protein